ncbi:unnamed protein product [Phytophthora lilii]|uniref:Unnamed protein product n=1 Tax=Phytophthora lilii TaxID=2077276 RepID=A0A9W6THR6_9STRA|nr:unnamed protein product [Phytophthora lilii]
MSALDIEWQRPVTPDGPTPLQLLLDWFSHNAVVFHASSHQREVLGSLCAALNARGVGCELDQLVDYVSFLQESVHDSQLPADLAPHRQKLQELLFKDGRLAAPSPRVKTQPSSRLSWLKPSAAGGPSAMEVMVEWLRDNYSAYAHATRKGGKGRMLEELVHVMKCAGHEDCAVNTVRSKIDTLQREVRGEKTRSTAYEQFGAVLEEIFTVGDADELKEDADDVDMDNPEAAEPVKKENMSLAEKLARCSPSGRLSWMKASATGGRTAMELLVEWLERNYSAYTHSSKKGDKGRMLAKLHRQIEATGHRGCTIHAIRVKIDSLQRQAEGKARPSAAFDLYGPILKKVFSGDHKAPLIEPRKVSPHATVAVEPAEAEDLRKSDEEGSEDNADSLAVEIDEDPIASTLDVNETSNGLAIEQTTMSNINSRKASMSDANGSPSESSSSSDSDTEEERPQAITVPEVRRSAVSPPSSSTNEIVRIATLLRERHDLLQRGVPQEQVDKFLPLPDV